MRAITAMQTKVFSEEIIPVQVQDRKGEKVLITEDENPREEYNFRETIKVKACF